MRSATQFQKNFDKLLRSLPQPICLEENPIIEVPESCFISISGFESRCVAATTQLAAMNWHAKATICVHYAQAEMLQVNARHKDKLYQALNDISPGSDPKPLKFDGHDFNIDFDLPKCSINNGNLVTSISFNSFTYILYLSSFNSFNFS